MTHSLIVVGMGEVEKSIDTAFIHSSGHARMQAMLTQENLRALVTSPKFSNVRNIYTTTHTWQYEPHNKRSLTYSRERAKDAIQSKNLLAFRRPMRSSGALINRRHSISNTHTQYSIAGTYNIRNQQQNR